MSILQSKTGLLSIVNLVIAAVVVGLLGDAMLNSNAFGLPIVTIPSKGNYPVLTVSSAVVLFMVAGASLMMHVVAVVTSFMGGDEGNVVKSNFYAMVEVTLGLVLLGSAISLLVVLGNFNMDIMAQAKLAKFPRIGKAAGAMGVIGAVTHLVTGFLAKRGM